MIFLQRDWRCFPADLADLRGKLQDNQYLSYTTNSSHGGTQDYLLQKFPFQDFHYRGFVCHFPWRDNTDILGFLGVIFPTLFQNRRKRTWGTDVEFLHARTVDPFISFPCTDAGVALDGERKKVKRFFPSIPARFIHADLPTIADSFVATDFTDWHRCP